MYVINTQAHACARKHTHTPVGQNHSSSLQLPLPGLLVCGDGGGETDTAAAATRSGDGTRSGVKHIPVKLILAVLNIPFVED